MKNTEKAFIWIINILEKNNIQYKISGGFAARVYGVDRELADIDIDVLDSDISIIAEQTKDYIIYGPERYKNEDWDLELLTLEYEGQEIDIAGMGAKIFNHQTNNWYVLSGNFDNVSVVEVFGKRVNVLNIDALIEYKTKLAREVDLEDVRQLKLIHSK